MNFAEMAKAAGLIEKPFYTIREVSIATGVPQSTLRDECAARRLTVFMPPGKMRGMLIRPEWVDDWIDRGTLGAA